MSDTAVQMEISAGALRRLQVLYSDHGDRDYIGEPVSIIAHSLQAAFQASTSTVDDPEIVVASLLHDIGHVLGLEAALSMRMGGCGIVDHEKIGEDFVKKLGLSDRIARLVRSHVSAKRYLCYKNPDYHHALSDASKTTLGYQGGPMSEEEAQAFEKDPDFKNYLLMRSFDEAAKVPGAVVPPLETYFRVISPPKNEVSFTKSSDLVSSTQENVDAARYILSDVQLRSFHENGFLKVTNLLDFEGIKVGDVAKWCDEIAGWPKTDGKYLQHWEQARNAQGELTGEKIMCRCENFLDYHTGMHDLARSRILHVVHQLFGEPAVLFKEKINHKLPGGAGFRVHQDTPAYMGMAADHITAMVAIDPANSDNGCLQVARGQWKADQLKMEDGMLTEDAVRDLLYEPVHCAAGDMLFFTGYIPHRSDANTSARSRRAMFLTYNPISQGDHRTAYYAAKHSGMQGFNKSNSISFQNDFQGTVVD